MEAVVKQEIVEDAQQPHPPSSGKPPRPSQPSLSHSPIIDIDSSSDSDSDSDDGVGRGGVLKKQKREFGAAIPLPLGFLDPLPPVEHVTRRCAPPHRPRQFWKAGEDFEAPARSPSLPSGGMDHVRVHPKFLHSNATSHKWALGAFAELLDNALDEVRNGATFVKVDVLQNEKDMTKMLVIEDNGGGMDPEKMRQCMSLGYSAKSKFANTIGQYGNGFKTSTMRLGADVIMFSRHCGKSGKRATQSIGMLSYTFLTKTGKEDIVVPMLDFEKRGSTWTKIIRSSLADWDMNLETILSWSPYASEAGLLKEFDSMTEQGTRIIIYNLWGDEDGRLELDFSADRQDIQLGGVNRDEKKIQMARQCANSRHFLTYQHSLRSYASILYLRLPPNFKIILRGEEVQHHNIVNDMMLSQEVTYKPQAVPDGVMKDPNLVAVVTIGFVKDARDHIDVQGFNVYYRNRLIKPFWRVWNASGSDGRGVIGVLEANFVEPAHDKQGFERTTVLSRLESRLVQMQKHYWSTNCHRIGYAPRRNKKAINGSSNRDNSREFEGPSGQHLRRDTGRYGASPGTAKDPNKKWSGSKNGQFSKAKSRDEGFNSTENFGLRVKRLPRLDTEARSISGSDSETENIASDRITRDSNCLKIIQANTGYHSSSSPIPSACAPLKTEADDCHRANGIISELHPKDMALNNVGNEITSVELIIQQLKEENYELKDRLKKMENSLLCDLEQEKERNKLLTEKLEEAERKIDGANKEQESLIDIFSDERMRRDKEEENLRGKLKDAAVTIQELLQKLAKRSGA